MKPDALSVIEAAYQCDLAPSDWLRGIVAAAYPQIGAGRGLLGFEYRVTPAARLEIGRTLDHDMPDGAAAEMRPALEALPPGYIRKTFVRCKCDTYSQGSDSEMRQVARPFMDAIAARFGWHDIFIVGAMAPDGHGVFLGAWLPRTRRLSLRMRRTWARVAVHLVAANRLRQRLCAAEARRADAADAVLTPGGAVVHAQGEAVERHARAALREAVRGVERARTRRRREADVDRAVEGWRGLVAARWTLVEHFESDGRRYVLARRNDVAPRGLAALTPRERQALGYAALGHSNKLIAYEMGIASSTVGVLLHRAAAKLGAATRPELIARFAAARSGPALS